MTRRYRYDTGSIIDTQTGDVLTMRKATNQLNRQYNIMNVRKEHIHQIVHALRRELDKAKEDDNDALVASLTRIMNTRLDSRVDDYE